MRIKKTLLSALAVTLLLAGCGTKQTTPQSLSLKEAFGDKFLVGVALNTRQVAGKTVRQQGSSNNTSTLSLQKTA